MSVTPIRPTAINSCSALCAEHLGGHCPGDSCVYRSTTVTDAEWLKDWAVVDYRKLDDEENPDYQRGLRMGHRNARIQYARGRFVGFILGMLALGGLLAALWIIDWLAAR